VDQGFKPMMRSGLLKFGGGIMVDVGGGAGDLRNGVRTTSRIAFLVLIFSCLTFAMTCRLLFFRSDVCDRWVLRRVSLFDSGVFNRFMVAFFEGLDFWISFLNVLGSLVSTFAGRVSLIGLPIARENELSELDTSARRRNYIKVG
jgi:L-asparagine transporter-like permease